MEQLTKSKLSANGGIKTDIKTAISSSPHNDKVTTVICSPKLKYIATSSSIKEKRDFIIAIWPVIDDKSILQPESSATFRQFIHDEGAVNHKLRSVSDNHLVVVEYTSHNEPSIRVFVIFDLVRGCHIKVPGIPMQSHYHLFECAFLDNGDLVVINDTDVFVYTVNFFKGQSILKCKAAYGFTHRYTKCLIAKFGKLIPACYKYEYKEDDIRTQWDLETGSFSAQIPMDFRSVEDSEGHDGFVRNSDKTLLASYTCVGKPLKRVLNVYSAETGVKLFSHTLKENQYGIDFVCSGARLLVPSFTKYTRIDDPPVIDLLTFIDPLSHNSPVHPVHISLKESADGINVPLGFTPRFINQNKAIGIVDGLVHVRDIFQENHSRKDVQDCNNIYLQNFMKEIADNLKYYLGSSSSSSPSSSYNKVYSGNNITWSIFDTQDGEELAAFSLNKITYYWEPIDTRRGFYFNRIDDRLAGGIQDCRILSNEDFMVVNRSFILIFTLDCEHKIQISYWWDRHSLTAGEVKLDNLISVRYFEDILKYYEVEMENSKTNEISHPLHELIENNITDLLFFTLHAPKILKAAIKYHRGDVVELVCDQCMEFFQANQKNLAILSIISSILFKLDKYYPGSASKFLAQTTLVMKPMDHVHIHSTFYPHLYTYTLEHHMFRLDRFSKFYLNLYRSSSKFMLDLQNSDLWISSLEFLGYNRKFKRPALDLFIPLSKFSSYPVEYNFWKELLGRPQANGFVKMQTAELYSDWNGEALLNFKWNTFGKYYYFFNWFVYTIFLGTFAFAATDPKDFISQSNQRILLWLCIILGFFHLSFEIRQFIFNWKDYILSAWNFFDLGAYILPVATSIYWINYGPPPLWAPAMSNLFLDLKFLFFLRPFESFGVYFAMITGVARKAHVDEIRSKIREINGHDWHGVEKPVLHPELLKIIGMDKSRFREC
ncbi:16923_t:CDS:2 [Dentiscutata erythropus]|uniref:16923_t:CDS:1 n=1 Tax=Dentiscutata erythropus TaxID=1348616 RepID=A0A9N9CSK8_9GLOM|nr:16923_t:CDS:2 [Dentiscutata erythropus]